MNESILLIKSAIFARKKAYAPYSDFTVGAALVTEDGNVYTGCNIENSSYPCGICAERVAFSKAISDGHYKFSAIAVVGGKSEMPCVAFCTPCGMCRQFMSEFCDENFSVICAKTDTGDNVTDIKEFSLGELLPNGFEIKK